MSEIFWFPWQRSVNGYKITKEDNFRCLSPVGDRQETYFPLQLPSERHALFQIFLELEETPEAVLDFANTYGLLDKDWPEPISTWFASSNSMRLAYEAWQRGDIDDVIDFYNRGKKGNVAVQFIKNNSGQPEFRIVPSSLLFALWIQFVEAVVADLKIKSCKLCGKPFAYGPGTGKRKTAVYCSPRCQKRHAYKRSLETEQ